ncbi:DUF1801 domain-containing protein [Blastococcus sp. CT_GayMR16]|uniref:iron chaperone n=1 Tax=Blastococcus sp. CT_GayMR16 TaxID=2559607 RepID=UPI0010734FED|nr:DUF1801 domain-containing protein [Blastococcus sp. CT_GayMR16]TFV82961.1 DUF1801 domain-containing protein [Blastococcus sp. CT_GayMR16]
MATPDPAVDAYVEQVTGPRADAVRTLRGLCLAHLDGFTEGMTYGMPGYWRGPVAEGEGEIAFAAQKQYLSFYVVRTDVMAAHRDRLAGLSVGKGCVRYRTPEQLDVDIVTSILEMAAATQGPIC